MAMFQLPPEGYRVVEELRIQLGIDDCQMRAAHAAWQCGHPSKVEFVTNEVVDPICGVQVPGKEEHYSVLTGNGIRLLDWTAKNKADMFCIAAPGGKPFVVVDYNYHALKGKAFVLEKITEYEELFKKGLPPKAILLQMDAAEISFAEDIPRELLSAAVEYNGFQLQDRSSSMFNPALSSSLSAGIARHDVYGLVYTNGGWVFPVDDDLEAVKAGTRILVNSRPRLG